MCSIVGVDWTVSNDYRDEVKDSEDERGCGGSKSRALCAMATAAEAEWVMPPLMSSAELITESPAWS